MVTGLLLLAFVFFVFAQAATTRSDAQSAADAAALAAAHEARDHLYDRFLDDLGGDGELDDILAGEEFPTESACDEAAPRLAARNNADMASCGPRDCVPVGGPSRRTDPADPSRYC
jgi:Flp pilus assembly protein TadG